MSSRTGFYERKMTEKRNRGNQRISNIIHKSPRICSSRAVDSACNTRRSSGSLCMRVDEDESC